MQSYCWLPAFSLGYSGENTEGYGGQKAPGELMSVKVKELQGDSSGCCDNHCALCKEPILCKSRGHQKLFWPHDHITTPASPGAQCSETG